MNGMKIIPLLLGYIFEHYANYEKALRALYCTSKQFSVLHPDGKYGSCFIYIVKNVRNGAYGAKYPIRFILNDHPLDVSPAKLIGFLRDLVHQKTTRFGPGLTTAVVGECVYLLQGAKIDKIYFPSLFWTLEDALHNMTVEIKEPKEARSLLEALMTKLRFERLHPILSTIDIMKRTSSSRLQLNIDHFVNRNVMTDIAPVQVILNDKTYRGAIKKNQGGGYVFAYKASNRRVVSARAPSLFIKKIIAVENLDVQAKGYSWKSLRSHGKTLCKIRWICELNLVMQELQMIPGVTCSAISNGRLTVYTNGNIKELCEKSTSPMFKLVGLNFKQENYTDKPE